MPEITVSQVIQLVGVLVSFLVVANQILSLIVYGRRGSPEIRAMRDEMESSTELLRESNDQMRSNNDKLYQLLERVMDRLDDGG